MSNYNKIFFRDATSQPYYVKKCAMWLFSIARFRTYHDAYDYLIWLEINKPNKFAFFMSEYHRVHDFKTGYITEYGGPIFPRVNNKLSVGYGSDSHMYYTKSGK